MSGTRVLLKMIGPVATDRAFRANLTSMGPAVDVRVRHIFDVPATAGTARSPGLTAQPAAWYVAEAADAGFGAASAHPWDLAHSALTGGLSSRGSNRHRRTGPRAGLALGTA